MTGPSPDSGQTGQGRYTVHKAALLLGLSVEAIRKRVERGKRQIEFLREELAARNVELRHREEEYREESRRKDHLLAATLERIPAIEEASPEAREAPETGSDLKPGVWYPQGDDAGAEVYVSPPWWRRLFSG